MIDIDVETNYVRIKLQDQILQLRLEEEICPDATSVERCSSTGELSITIKKVREAYISFCGDEVGKLCF
jgi:hypothetical protein